jgi:hypothetical protein
MLMEMESNLHNGYVEAYKLAAGKLASLDPFIVCHNTGAEYNYPASVYKIKYINREYCFDNITHKFYAQDECRQPTATESVLVLHYMVNACFTQPAEEKISFREIPGAGNIYYPAFKKRAIDPLVSMFSKDPEKLKYNAAVLGGKSESFGNSSVTLYILPYVYVTYIVWLGDDEIPASGTILFDKNIISFLSGEDIVIAASFGVYELMGIKTDSNKGGRQ